MSILIVDNYDSFTFNLFQLIAVLDGNEPLVKRNDQIDFEFVRNLAPSHIVLSPGPGHPAVERDFGICRQLIEMKSELNAAVLGVCLGHQGIVHFLGGKVCRAEKAVHGKMSRIRLKGRSPLFSGIESGSLVMRYHSLVAEKSSLPARLEITAELDEDDKEALLMAVQDRKERLFGVQFHPESVGTAIGKKLLENFLRLC